MQAGGGFSSGAIELASPVKVGKGSEKRYGMLVAAGGRLQLITARGVELDVDRRELVGAKAADSLPRITFALRGEQHRYALVAGRPSHDGSGLVAGMKGQPHYAQQASAVPRWNDWLHPRTPEQLAEIERHRQAFERTQRFSADERADAGLLQSPVWHLGTGAPGQLQLAGDELALASSDGSVLRLGPASRAGVSWSGSGRTSVLHVRSGADDLALAFRPPKIKGGGSGGSTGSDADAVGLVVALPLLAFFSFSDRRKEKQRVSRWRAALPGDVHHQ